MASCSVACCGCCARTVSITSSSAPVAGHADVETFSSSSCDGWFSADTATTCGSGCVCSSVLFCRYCCGSGFCRTGLRRCIGCCWNLRLWRWRGGQLLCSMLCFLSPCDAIWHVLGVVVRGSFLHHGGREPCHHAYVPVFPIEGTITSAFCLEDALLL